MGKIRAGVVGVGYLGKFHAEKYADADCAELIGVVDIEREQAAQVAKKNNTRAFTDYRELFGRVDAVSIAVTTPEHYQIAKAFLENGVDVLIEKPITTTIDEADELIDIAEERGLILQVGHLERFNPAVLAVKDIIKNPMFIESNRLSLYHERGTDVSVVLDLMIHDIDIILNFVRSKISYSHAMGAPVVSGHVDIANAHLEFENGAVANATASRISSKNERKIRLFQKDGYLSLDFANRSIIHIWPGEEDGGSVVPGMQMEERSFEQGDALKDEIRSFLDAVDRRGQPEVSGQMGREALNIALSITRQIRESSRWFMG
ncbi:MAG: Gfo/Idh/MocA family oxidoreductase [Desulfobacterales bacterium]|nr:Gfo/Idh/MocA family oxidoreductase [Desulfobacterales bacterium]